jgi:hypothetical protein
VRRVSDNDKEPDFSILERRFESAIVQATLIELPAAE